MDRAHTHTHLQNPQREGVGRQGSQPEAEVLVGALELFQDLLESFQPAHLATATATATATTRACVRVCMCVCVCARARVRVHVCVCARERVRV